MQEKLTLNDLFCRLFVIADLMAQELQEMVDEAISAADNEEALMSVQMLLQDYDNLVEHIEGVDVDEKK